MATTPDSDHDDGNPHVDMDGDVHLNGTHVYSEASLVRLGAPTVVTIATGVATITGSFVALAAESGTADQLDTLTLAGAAAGDYVLIVPDTGDTITVDDANINLGAATRAVAPGGHISLYFDGTEWNELTFLAGADNIT